MNYAVRVGDLGCPGIDVDKWEEENRVPLFPDKIQRWILVRTDRDTPTDAEIEQTLKAALGRWFREFKGFNGPNPFEPLDPRGIRGLVDSVKVERISRGERLSFNPPIKRREQLKTIPTVEANVPIWISVTFAYRGTAPEMPWPVRKGGGIQLSSSARCPIQADWMLDQVASPEQKPAPPRPPLSDAVLETATDVVHSSVSLLGLPIVIVAGLLGLVIWARKG